MVFGIFERFTLCVVATATCLLFCAGTGAQLMFSSHVISRMNHRRKKSRKPFSPLLRGLAARFLRITSNASLRNRSSSFPARFETCVRACVRARAHARHSLKRAKATRRPLRVCVSASRGCGRMEKRTIQRRHKNTAHCGNASPPRAVVAFA